MSDNRKQIDLARQTLEMFIAHGEDMADTRHVVHYFYGGNFVALGASLRELGYETRPTVNDDGVIAERHEAIGEEWRTTTLAHLCELADSYGTEYDGWEAAMTRQDVAPQPQPQPQTEPQPKPASFLSKLFGKKN